MLKFLFDYLTDSYSLLENPIDNYIIMAVVGVIAYMISYNIVGWFYHADLIDGYSAGHILHWIVRFVVFVVLYYAFATAIRIYNWMVNVPAFVWWSILGAAVFLVIIIGLVKLINWKREQVARR